ncbi:MAG: DEAD/DEAH box helicase, partial [Methylococcaceae bacterium]|nr:DEAD/DEAH box helicase [Methylococcaceae bacterium]
VLDLLHDNGIELEIQDKRHEGCKIDVAFEGTLRSDQRAAVDDLLDHDTGILCAPTAFGKTVTAAAMIARRGVNTLILVHRSELIHQWRERLETFLELKDCPIGKIGAGRSKPTGQIDIATMQALSRKGEVSELPEKYGHIVVDECHHLSAVSFEAIVKSAKARYVLGLTATPVRRDGKHPIIFMHCGPIRHQAGRMENMPSIQEVHPRFLDTVIDLPESAGIQDVFKQLVHDPARNTRIATDILSAYAEGRKLIVLTGRTEHLALLESHLAGKVEQLFVLQGRMPKKQRTDVLARVEALDESAPRVLLATASLVGEGFDHPPLNTLVLAMPVSWEGSLKQYAGRLHRAHTLKSDVRIYDYVETEHAQLVRMWDKRRKGYAAMGYRIITESSPSQLRSD